MYCVNGGHCLCHVIGCLGICVSLKLSRSRESVRGHRGARLHSALRFVVLCMESLTECCVKKVGTLVCVKDFQSSAIGLQVADGELLVCKPSSSQASLRASETNFSSLNFLIL